MAKVTVSLSKPFKPVTAAGGKPTTLPPGVVAVNDWQSASSRLDADLADSLKKAGAYIYFIDGDSREYSAVIIANKKLSAAVINKIQDDVASYINLK